jgi:hypothetical protein
MVQGCAGEQQEEQVDWGFLTQPPPAIGRRGQLSGRSGCCRHGGGWPGGLQDDSTETLFLFKAEGWREDVFWLSSCHPVTIRSEAESCSGGVFL